MEALCKDIASSRPPCTHHYMGTQTYVCVYIYVCVYVCIYIWYMDMNINIYTETQGYEWNSNYILKVYFSHLINYIIHIRAI